MQYKRKLFFLCATAVLIFALLSSCDKAAKSDKAIVEDLQADSRFFSAAEIQITDFTISKRQTATENRRDTVWITAVAGNEDISCELSYIMTYNLYNSGWLLDNVERDHEGKWEVNPLHGIDEDVINENIEAYTENTFTTMEKINKSTNLANHTDIVTYAATKEHKYGNETMTVEQIFYFDPEDCCYYPASELSIYDRSLILKDAIIGAKWMCTRYHDKFDAWPDRFEIEATKLFQDEDGDMWVTFDISRERNTYWGGNEPVYWGVHKSFAVPYFLEYLEGESKWGFNMYSTEEYLYSKNDGERFTEDEWFCFDLDNDGVGYFTEYHLVENADEHDPLYSEIQQAVSAAFEALERGTVRPD